MAQAPTLPYRTVVVAIDSRPPVLNTALVAGPLTPTSVLSAPPFAATAVVPAGSGSLIDPSNPNGSLGSSGGTGLNRPGYVADVSRRHAHQSGGDQPLRAAAGAHSMRTWVNDAAGNSAWYTVSFTISVAADGTRSIGSIVADQRKRRPTPSQRPFVTPTAMTPNPNATYKVLIVGRTQGFRHNHIPDSDGRDPGARRGQRVQRRHLRPGAAGRDAADQPVDQRGQPGAVQGGHLRLHDGQRELQQRGVRRAARVHPGRGRLRRHPRRDGLLPRHDGAGAVVPGDGRRHLHRPPAGTVLARSGLRDLLLGHGGDRGPGPPRDVAPAGCAGRSPTSSTTSTATRGRTPTCCRASTKPPTPAT